MNSVITLTTDFGADDAYVAIMKGVILSTNPEVNIVDITHSVEPQNVYQAAFILGYTYRYFPKKTVHVAVVDPGVGSERRGVILKTPSALFVAPDNGILSYVIDELSSSKGSVAQYSPDQDLVTLGKGFEVVAITEPRFWRQPVSTTFHGRDIFAPVAATLTLDISPYELGEKITSLHVFPILKPLVDYQGNLIGHILHVDHFGNLITNIKKSDLPGKDIPIEVAGRLIQGITDYYAEGEELMAIIGSSGYLEIALKNGSAADFLNIGIGDEIKVTLEEED
ncbi:MAG: SAM-dependent chlorinase/fluorinase [Dehalococcoidales bacterium]|nr:SAM-dependent chlorinase/fluorinase [Dehalococcoidales bacterium]